LLADPQIAREDTLIKVVKHSAVIYFVVTAFLLLGINYGDNNTAKAQTPNQEEQKENQDISKVQEENEDMDDKKENELEDKNDENDEDKDDIPLEFEVPIPFP
jgi:hypothetical protein